MKFTGSAATLALLALTACSGGDAPGLHIDPVIASGPPAANLGDLAGTTLPLRMAYSRFDGTLSTGRETWGVEVVSGTELRLLTSEGTIDLTYDGVDSFDGTLNGVDYSARTLDLGYAYSDMMRIGIHGPGEEGMVAGSFGLQAPEAAIDDLSAASAVLHYNGASQVVLNGATFEDAATGTANVTIDFASGAVTGSVFANPDMELVIVDGVQSGAGFGGALELGGPSFAGFDATSSGIEGFIYGLNGTEVGGTYGGTATGAAGDFDFHGAFGATK